MVDILVIGDSHIPDRAMGIPKQFKDLIEREKPWQIVIFTGDLTCEEVLRWVRSLGEKIYIVRGNMDYLPLPKTAVLEVEGLKIGVHHGDGFYPRGDPVKLSKIAHNMGVDVLISGHTHADFIKLGVSGNELLINPGSITGVWGGGGGSYTPSFMILKVYSSEIYTYIHRLVGVTHGIESSIITRHFNKWIIEQ